jgi:hypothetical protein
MGLLSFVPVLGWIAAYGWMLATVDRLRDGRRELPAPGLYLGRGWRLFLVIVVYGLAVAAIAGLLMLAGFAAASALRETAAALLGVLVVLFGASIGLLGVLVVSTLLLPAVAIATDRGGVGAGLNVGPLLRGIEARRQTSISAALLLLVAYAVGGLGSALCLVGAVLTTGYSLPLMAGIVRGYERDLVYSSGQSK